MPVTLNSLRGRIGDLDSHELIPANNWAEVFGEPGRRFVELNKAMFERIARELPPEENMLADHPDTMAITEQSVWEKRGHDAPSANDLNRRIEVLDVMGIRRQLVFPGFGTLALAQALGGGVNGILPATLEQIQNGKDSVQAYNDWAGRLTNKHPERLCVVGMLDTWEAGTTPEHLAKKAEAMMAKGVKAIMITAGGPPAGMSPADPRLDSFYATLAAANVPLIFHPPSGVGFRKSDMWGMVPGVLMDLSWPVAIHQSEENFLCVMTLGGVFERHPTLRVAFVETGGSWIGPLAERMDDGVLEIPKANRLLSRKPSEYLASNVRVAVLLDERVERWIERHPHLQSVYCYSSDFPHYEGRQWSLQKFFERVSPLGDDIVEKFFVTNSQLILDQAA
jgi:predicted TIM-barrel fold metal-dependent hydrolase